MIDIEIGEYVRTISGNIDKVDALYGMIDNAVHLEKHKWQDIKNILKHSKNIIDLIEPGDYVNGKKVNSISQGYVYEEFDFDTATAICSGDKIKSIVTHEQFAQMEYRIGE